MPMIDHHRESLRSVFNVEAQSKDLPNNDEDTMTVWLNGYNKGYEAGAAVVRDGLATLLMKKGIDVGALIIEDL